MSLRPLHLETLLLASFLEILFERKKYIYHGFFLAHFGLYCHIGDTGGCDDCLHLDILGNFGQMVHLGHFGNLVNCFD